MTAPTPAVRQVRLRGAWIACGLVLALLGCGKKGPPLPPIPRIPVPAGPLQARQAGDRFEVRVPLPVSMAGERPIDRLTGLKLYRIERPLRADGEAPAFGPADFTDDLAPVFTMPDAEVSALAPGETWAYREPAGDAGAGIAVRAVAFSARFRAAGKKWSSPAPPATVVAGPPPQRPAGLAAEPTADGVSISWQPGPAVAIFRSRPGQLPPFAPLSLVAAGGSAYLDTTAGFGQAWSYEVRATVGSEPQLRYSAAAGALQVTRVDRFAPAPPGGFSALPRAGGVDLFWTQSTEPDAAAYRVYRRDLPDGAWHLVTDRPLATSTWTDTGVEPGKEYLYRVTALDGSTPANESGFSTERRVVVPVPQEPPAGGTAP